MLKALASIQVHIGKSINEGHCKYLLIEDIVYTLLKTDKVLVRDKTGWTSYSDENVSAVSKRTFSSGFHQVISTNWNIIACLIFFVQRNFVIAMYIKDSHSRVLIVSKFNDYYYDTKRYFYQEQILKNIIQICGLWLDQLIITSVSNSFSRILHLNVQR